MSHFRLQKEFHNRSEAKARVELRLHRPAAGRVLLAPDTLRIVYLTLVRRRWMRTARTMTNSKPATTRIIIVDSISFPFLELSTARTCRTRG